MPAPLVTTPILAATVWQHALHASHGVTLVVLITSTALAVAAIAVTIVKIAAHNRRARQASELDAVPEQHEAAGWIVSDGEPSAVASIEIEEARERQGKELAWVEKSRSLKARPFVVRQGPGRDVAVEPGPDPVLVDVPVVRRSRRSRTRRLELSAETMVYATGKLVLPEAQADPGAYRSATTCMPRLVRPESRPMLLSIRSRVDRAYARAARWRRLLKVVVGFLLLSQAVGFGPFYLRHFAGETLEAPFVAKRLQRGKSTTYYVKVLRPEDGKPGEYVASSRTYEAAGKAHAIPMRSVRGMPFLDQFGEEATANLGIVVPLVFLLGVWSLAVFGAAYKEMGLRPEDDLGEL